MTTDPTSAITFRHVVKRYGPVTALDDVEFEVRGGELVALLGPKTTAVEVLLGLRRADGGDVRVLGGSPEQAVTAGRVGARPQQGALPGNARVGEVLRLVRALYGRRRSPAELLAVAGLTGAARRKVDTLPGGQAQRLRFALALRSTRCSRGPCARVSPTSSGTATPPPAPRACAPTRGQRPWRSPTTAWDRRRPHRAVGWLQNH